MGNLDNDVCDAISARPLARRSEMLILWIGIYQLYRAFRATRGASILVGIVMILAIATSLAFIFQLKVIAWILTRAVLYGAFALVIIFQPELRSALANWEVVSFLLFQRRNA